MKHGDDAQSNIGGTTQELPRPEHCTREVTKAERKGRRAEQQHDTANLKGLGDVVTPLLA